MTLRRTSVCLFVTISLAVSSFTALAAADLSELNNKLQLNTREQNTLNTQIRNNERQQRDVSAELLQLEKAIEKAEAEVDILQREILASEEKITAITKDLDIAEDNIDSNSDLLASRINVMYRNGNIGYLEVILGSESFPELLTNLDMIKMVVEHDVELLNSLKEQRDKIEDKKIQLENQRKHLVSLKGRMERKQQELQVSRGQQERLRVELQQDKNALEKQLDQLEKEANELEAQVRKLQTNGEYVGGELQWPTPGFTRITSPYGNRIHPILRTRRFHSGIDIAAPMGATVVASGHGTVAFSGTLGSYGKTIIIDHGGGIMTLYAHNSKLTVDVGDSVSRGDKVAEIGSTGLSTGPHLHFEVRKDGKFVDPIPYVKGN